ncbi:Protein CBG27516 [Caenorhabditis briggsae]|uniref:Protein CBG27516 n=1 Tax=Caenorhabditis briggsae TaxID=6238 RepID=B6IF31_CAEBR|nr:Protein CBG27516 [Caenorhabditis briggsae]CAR98511.1 Protein CBG27516 [Caenorhabditis briggsae]
MSLVSLSFLSRSSLPPNRRDVFFFSGSTQCIYHLIYHSQLCMLFIYTLYLSLSSPPILRYQHPRVQLHRYLHLDTFIFHLFFPSIIISYSITISCS